MRSILIGLIGLLAGAAGALAYSHYLGEGKQLADAQSALTEAQTELTAAKDSSQLSRSENKALTDQVQQLIASRDKLQKQIDDGAGANSSPSPATPNFPAMFGGVDMKSIVKQQTEQRNNERLQMLISRLHLTPDQIAKVKAAMDAENAKTEEMAARMLSGQKVDMKTLVAEGKGFQSSDQVLQSLLTPDQKTAYQQMQNDEKTSTAESIASSQMNQVAPLLNLSESQKDQVESALYQVQMNSEDPNWIKNNAPNTAGNPLALMDAEEKAKEDALASVLTPDQLATYKQQAQAQLNLQKTMMQKFMPAAAQPAPAP